MLVKTSKKGIESAWVHLTAKLRDDIINDDPDWIFVKVEDIYPGSPDAGKVIKLEKSVFSVVAKDFIQEHKRQERETERHVDNREFESIKVKEFRRAQISPESRLINQETQKRLDRAMAKLTQTQRRRIHLGKR